LADRGLLVKLVDPAGIGAEVGIGSGDRVLAVNGSEVRDILDFMFLAGDEEIEMLVHKPGGEDWLLEIEKDYDDYLGLEFEGDGLGRTRRCANRCLFCFVDQMPPDMRESLYVKDDDYRLTFLQGNFITLTNIAESELQRIIAYRLSPLYVSVHATNPELRAKMMGNPGAALIMDQLRSLAGAGLEMHTQVVLCPGLNDGMELERTIEDLAGLWPAVASVAIVPVGLTGYRGNLYTLRSFRPEEAASLLGQVEIRQRQFNQDLDYPFVFAADEFYLLAGRDIPPAGSYGGFPQTENGVGLVRLFLDEWHQVRRLLPASIPRPRRVTVATGQLAAEVLAGVADELNQVQNLTVELLVVKNHYFGGSVTVAGLVTGADILAACRGKDPGDLLVIPGSMLRSDGDMFLDGLTPAELSLRLNVAVDVAAGPGEIINSVISD
jgi:putative radical SAM enzyme (TIGR03279 family)